MINGLNYLTLLSCSCIARSNESEEDKRNLLFSMYSFRCLFDQEFLTAPPSELFDYGCCFTLLPSEHPDYESDREYFDSLDRDNVTYVKGGGIYTEISGKKVIKYDAGGNLWRKMVKAHRLDGIAATLPNKFTLYEMAYRIMTLSTSTKELVAMWYINFPFVVAMGAPHERDIYDQMKALINEEVFEVALESKYSDVIYVSTKEMVLGGVNPIIIDWLIEFTEWKNVKNDKGVSRETQKYQKCLAKGEFDYVISGTERMLDVFPDDEELQLMNIAAKTSVARDKSVEEREKLLNDNISLIKENISKKTKKQYYAYFLGLSFLGLQKPEEAENAFKLSLTYDQDFELAKAMLKGLSALN